MRSSYLILKDKKLVIDIYNGILTIDGFKKHKLKQAAEPDFDPEYNLLSDFTKIEVHFSLEEVKEYTDFLQEQRLKVVGKRKAAVVVSNPNQLLYAKQYDKNVKDISEQELVTFLNFNEALAWLNLSDSKQEIMALIEKYRKKPMFEWKSYDETLG